MSTTGTAPEVYTVSHVAVSIDGLTDGGMNNLLFSSASPPSWTIDASKHVYHGDNGSTESIISAIQNPKYSPMQLTQGWDEGMVLAKWKALIEDPSTAIADKKKHVKVDFLKSDGSILFSWDAQAAILTAYNHSASDAASNAVLTVTATIDADIWTHLDSSGSPITGS
jgi:phage tail-like protein